MRLTISCYFLYYFRFHRKKYMLAADTEASHSVVHSARHWGKMTPDTAVAADTANTGLHYYIDYLARQSLRLYCAEQTVQKE